MFDITSEDFVIFSYTIIITDFSGVNTLPHVHVLIFLNILNGFSDMINEKVLKIQYLLFLLL